MLARIAALWLIGLVLCPVTAPFSASELPGLVDHGDHGASQPGRCCSKSAADHSSAALVPAARVRTTQSHRLTELVAASLGAVPGATSADALWRHAAAAACRPRPVASVLRL